MKKFFYRILAVLAILLIVGYTFLFTAFGNGIVANIAKDRIKQNAGLDVNITHFVLRPGSVSLKADLANLLNLNIEGNLSLFRLAFEIDYKVIMNKNSAHNLGLNFDENIKLNGQVFGKLQDFVLTGKGSVLGSNVQLDSRIYEFNPISLDLQVRTLKIEKLFTLLALPQYAKGQIDIVGKIEAKNFKPDGNAIIKLDMSSINYKEIKKVFGLDLPQNSNLKSEILATIKDNVISAKSEIKNAYFNIQSQKTFYDLTENVLQTDFILKIPDMSKLQSLTKTKLNGVLVVDGNLEFVKNIVKNLNVNVKGLGGLIQAKLKENKLQAVFDRVSLEKVFALVALPNYANGTINGVFDLDNIDLTNFTKLNGKMNLNSQGTFNASTLSILLNKKFPSNEKYTLKAQALIKNNSIDFDVIADTNFVKLNDWKGEFDLFKTLLHSDFSLELNDFSKLGFLFERKLSGNAQFNGKINFNKGLDVFVQSEKLFEGKFVSTLKNNMVNADLQEVELSSLTKSLDFIDLYQGKANAKAQYNLATEQGEVVLDMKEGRLQKNAITEAFRLFTLKDITNDVFHTAKANAKIIKNLIHFNLTMQAQRSSIDVNSASFDSNNGVLNVPFEMKLDRADLKGRIEGTSQKPKIQLDVSSVVNTIKNILGTDSKNLEQNILDMKLQEPDQFKKLLDKLF
ncbi:hypothetical protein OQH60_01410 [Campylobacter sp. MIT 21-1685]|uniref:hypothetical protein n=1 Tax=unclassified Campylobacter TaxID=2593542 RepID=UPI00224B5550|nr:MULTISPECIES: hypothetical protein [unclassified Campylobacter]MCX2682534.1 hypothetical protein [Campylobacter sp. MIT 21-1684]MCX2750753.1 hypothetical protein [Campylobacter sp. MIT 21-1682]MCX2807015.1 hypothetical protein [Campylobacter sp. MIT 21-1685]